EKAGCGNRPSMRLLSAALVSCGLLAVLAPVAGAAGDVRYGIQDDAWLVHGSGTLDDRLDRLEGLGVDLVRFTLHWDRIEAERGAPDWRESDLVLEGLRARGIEAVVGFVGSPRWANGGRTPNFAPDAASVRAFAGAAASRYGWVTKWLVWNEPNQARWLRPTIPSVYVRQILNPAYTAIHAANRRARVAGGVTAPRGSTGGVSPVAWIRGMRSAGARLDAYAHHPYPSSNRETPFAGGCGHCTTITMASLERLLAEAGRAFGPKRIWLTEYGYQTGAYGVSQQRQADLIGQSALRVLRAPRVEILIHYLVKDEPHAGRFQSGLYSPADRAKLAASAFPLPIAQAGRSGSKLVLWGQVRPRSGVQRYRVQVRAGGGWRFSGGVRRTSARGFFSTAVAARKGTWVRIFSPEDSTYSASLLAR
ncbi:MAG: polysaccharide biosynthesis protein PslG, partial [Gaiellaceae bacterium]|nr:polysaccharide biosynthesis protein PslG [Gaiellaceae bacterium]